jgi:phenylalanyl-tRNA synthetase alpha subunit
MSEDIRKMINKVKNFNQSVNENVASDFYEKEELERSIEFLKIDVAYSTLEKAFTNAKPTILTPNIWRKLENTDYDVDTEEDVKEKLIAYNRDPHNYEKIGNEIKNGVWYYPLVLHLPDKYYLVAGNTRLMVSKVLNHTPMVKIVKIK